MRALGPIWLAGTCLVALAAPAVAQEAPPADTANETLTPEQEIVVTGVRQSLDKARAIKRDSTQFVDAIVASDIGSLPDTNVAESLARVSGVQLDRGIGEGTSIAIRGLRQNVTLYNGRELFDPTGRGGSGIDELGGSTYGLLALIPSELVASLQVTKLAGSDQIAGASSTSTPASRSTTRGSTSRRAAASSMTACPGEAATRRSGWFQTRWRTTRSATCSACR
jgi:outer membrane receptor protein involved in Fe transport